MNPSISLSESGIQLTIKLDDVLESLNDDQRRELVRAAAINEVIVKDIIDQLASGWTDDCSGLGDSFLNEMRQKLMPFMGEVAKEAIRSLVQKCANATLDAKRHSEWAWNMRRAWPAEYVRHLPPIPSFGYAHKIDAEDARKIAGVEAPEGIDE